LASIDGIDIHGEFDIYADVDVFILRLTRGTGVRSKQQWYSLSTASPGRSKISDYFDVHVGPVVPHRHPNRGTECCYIQSRMLPGWAEFDTNKSAGNRLFSGRTFLPPFVTVRRTSSPSDKNRVVPTLVLGDSPVAVENHLLILRPHENPLRMCRELMRILADERTRSWLEQRIRCRHLTVAALQDLPWWGKCYTKEE